MKLINGKIYDLNNLTLIGWTNGNGSGHEGYNVADYFDKQGRYLGPDQDGIEPDFQADQSPTVVEILAAKKESGDDAYLWLHDSGDCILWPTEESSENDDGKNAIERWQLTAAEIEELEATGEVDGH